MTESSRNTEQPPLFGADEVARLRRLPATVLGTAGFLTWGLVPFLAGLDRVLAIVAGA